MKHLFTAVFCLFSLSVFAQQPFQFRQMQNVKVVIGTDTLKQPWVGGLNSPVFSTIDLNSDGTSDLYAFDRNNNKSYTFLAVNTGGAWNWQYAPEYESRFPQTMTFWVLLRDYNNDGHKDLFTGTAGDVFVYKNITTANSPVTFASKGKRLRYNNFSNMAFGAYVLPSVTDMDNDGDMDILVFDNTAAQYVEYYKNLTIENAAPVDSLIFTRETDYYGSLNRNCGLCHNYAFNNNPCKVGDINHGGGGSLLAIDLDNDNDKDLLSGLDLCPDLARLTNQGTLTSAAFSASSLSTVYPANTMAASFVNYPAAYSEDVDFDGKKDLLVSPFMLDNQDKANVNRSVWYYRNMASSATAAPVYTFQKNNFLQEDIIDVGESAIPVFADIDTDGDLDMLVSNYADFRNGSGPANFKSTVSLFTNVGNSTKPIFKLTNPDYLSFSTADNNDGYKEISLQFGDMDGNGSKDLIYKYLHSSGSAAYVVYIPNSAQPNQPYSFNLANKVNIGLVLSTTDSPLFYDLDGDGDLDVLMGTQAHNPANQSGSGALHFHRRTGSNASLFSSWQMYYNDNAGNVSRDFNRQYVKPVISDLNNDGTPDLITGDNSGVLRIYPDFLSHINSTAPSQNNLLYNSIQNTYQPTSFGRLTNFPGRVNLHPAAADLDNDGKPELVIGTVAGGLVYFKNESVLGLNDELYKKALSLNIFPNPASEIVTITSTEKITITMFDAAGKEVKATGSFKKEQQLNVSNLKPGVYFLKIAATGFRSAGRTLVVQ